jgi:hypothetical protein
VLEYQPITASREMLSIFKHFVYKSRVFLYLHTLSVITLSFVELDLFALFETVFRISVNFAVPYINDRNIYFLTLWS